MNRTKGRIDAEALTRIGKFLRATADTSQHDLVAWVDDEDRWQRCVEMAPVHGGGCRVSAGGYAQPWLLVSPLNSSHDPGCEVCR